MFLVTQFIGISVVNHYILADQPLPYGLEPPDVPPGDIQLNFQFLVTLVISFAIAIFLIFLLMNIKSIWFMRAWFFVVASLAVGITLNVPASMYFSKITGLIIASVVAISLAYVKVYKRDIIIHNATELLIYPGIAAIFVSILNIWTTILLLLLISAYDIWAVWHSGVMQKMAKFQMEKVKVLGGFLIPYASPATRAKIDKIRAKYKGRIPEKVAKRQNLRVSLAILGGGDVIFPIIAAGVFLKTFQSMVGAIIVIAFATLALAYLFFVAEKRKFYPAMPYLTTGIFIGMIIAWLTVVL